MSLRVERHCENSMKVARHLENHPDVAWVRYPGLPSDPLTIITKGSAGMLLIIVEGILLIIGTIGSIMFLTFFLIAGVQDADNSTQLPLLLVFIK